MARQKAIGVFVPLFAVVAIVGAIAYYYARTPADTDDVVVVSTDAEDQEGALTDALLAASDRDGKITKLVIDDTVFGTGTASRVGDRVTVEYIGVIQGGQEFDNTYKKGEPLTFVIGEGEMVPGFERGIIGMQVGGKRTLVVPASLAYGNEKVGRILPGSTLIFLVELVAIE